MNTVIIYYTEISEEIQKKNLAHMIGEELLRIALKKEYGKELRFEPRDKGDYGKPFFTLQPGIHYNITHSGKYIACAFAEQPVGIDIQEHRAASYERILNRMVKEEDKERILSSEDMITEFFREWVLREAFIKWTGEGLSRDLKTINMNAGWYTFLPVDEGYSGAVFLPEEHEVCWIKEEVQLP